MHHKCVKCGKKYEHASEEILSGCICGSKLFYFVKGNGDSAKKEAVETAQGNPDIEYFYELEDDGEMIAFDLESIRVKSSGKYEIDLNGLMGENGLVYSYGDGKYSVDLEANMKKTRKRKR